MQCAYPEISDSHREHLTQRGIKVYQPAPLPNSINPFANECKILEYFFQDLENIFGFSSIDWLNNCLLLGFSLLGRHYAGKR